MISTSVLIETSVQTHELLKHWNNARSELVDIEVRQISYSMFRCRGTYAFEPRESPWFVACLKRTSAATPWMHRCAVNKTYSEKDLSDVCVLRSEEDVMYRLDDPRVSEWGTTSMHVPSAPITFAVISLLFAAMADVVNGAPALRETVKCTKRKCCQS